MAEKKTYAGGCHCGAVRFEVDAEIGQAIACNCSICAKHGLLLAFAPADQFRLRSGAEALGEYRFYKHKIAHRFCRTCGVESFAEGERPADGAKVIALNIRCLEGLDLAAIPQRPFDGAKL